jgi:outer membrane protein OmpA-like peptidoglycan-associated protein
MTRLAVPIVILLLMLFGGAVWMLNAYLDLPDPAATVEKSRSAKPAKATDDIKDLQSELSGQPAAPAEEATGSFDVARIDPEGTSVFAGRAAPGSAVTIMGDGQALGTAQADENGEWTFAIEHKFASADPELALEVKPAEVVAKEAAEQAAKDASDRTKVASAEQRGAAPAKPASERPSAKTVTKNLLKKLEGMVEAARTEPQKAAEPSKPETTTAAATPSQQAAAAPPSPSTPSAPPKDSATVKEPGAQKTAPSATVTAANEPSQNDTAQQKTVVPVPITFVFNEAEFTEPGKKAAGLLLEYLRLKQFKSVSLTGHADERGTNQLNMDLSRDRLETVSHFLKEGGFNGELELVPKGETQPFSGVDRSKYGREELFQLDRRVELVIN